MEHSDDFVIQDGVLEAYTGNAAEVVIPSGIVRIGKEAFRGNETLVSAAVPQGVTMIYQSAFQACRNLTEVKLPDELTFIGSNAFAECSSLHKIQLPAKLETIGVSAFEASGLQYILFHCRKNLKKNWKRAFYGVNGLSSVKLPDGLETIGEQAFADCAKLTYAVIPDSVKVIENNAFSGCKALRRIELPGRVHCAENAFTDTPYQKEQDKIASGAYDQEKRHGIVGWVIRSGGEVLREYDENHCLARFYRPKHTNFEIQYYYLRDEGPYNHHAGTIRLADAAEANAMVQDPDKVWERIYAHLKKNLGTDSNETAWDALETCDNSPEHLRNIRECNSSATTTFLALKPKYRIVQTDWPEREEFMRIRPHFSACDFDSQPVDAEDVTKAQAISEMRSYGKPLPDWAKK